MKRVFCSHDPMLAGYLRSVLEEHGIACLVKNEFLIGGGGELPPTECWPEVWVVDDGQEARARAIVEEVRQSGSSDEGWRCPVCAEWIEPGFGACWRCAGDAPDAPGADPA
ncbi:MAG: DUF2007 domain-containing protein [Immundisolibacterales bacterium]|nr:DUF2007 domain-containing protein [Immundisolibacterales bacterium]